MLDDDVDRLVVWLVLLEELVLSVDDVEREVVRLLDVD